MPIHKFKTPTDAAKFIWLFKKAKGDWYGCPDDLTVTAANDKAFQTAMKWFNELQNAENLAKDEFLTSLEERTLL